MGEGEGYFYLEEVFRRAVNLLEGLLAGFRDGLHFRSLVYSLRGLVIRWCVMSVSVGVERVVGWMRGSSMRFTSRW